MPICKISGIHFDQLGTRLKKKDVVANPVLRHILAGTPRVVCNACGEMFLYGSIVLRLKVGQKHVSCPKCKAADTLRDATPEEVANVVPKPNEWVREFTILLWLLVIVGSSFLLYALFQIYSLS